MTALMIIIFLVITIAINVASSSYVCFNVDYNPERPYATLLTVTGVVLLNTLIPLIFGVILGMYFM